MIASPGPALDTPSLVAKVKASVVNITVESSPKAQDAAMSPFEFFRRNGPGGRAPDVQKRHALGSGFLVDDEARVLTNAHVVAGADKVRVKLADEREFDARVLGKTSRSSSA